MQAAERDWNGYVGVR